MATKYGALSCLFNPALPILYYRGFLDSTKQALRKPKHAVVVQPLDKSHVHVTSERTFQRIAASQLLKMAFVLHVFKNVVKQMYTHAFPAT